MSSRACIVIQDENEYNMSATSMLRSRLFPVLKLIDVAECSPGKKRLGRDLQEGRLHSHGDSDSELPAMSENLSDLSE